MTFEERHRKVLEDFRRRSLVPYGRVVLLCFDVSTHNLRRLGDYLGVRRGGWHSHSRGNVTMGLTRFRRPEGVKDKCYDIVHSLLPQFDAGDVCPYCGVRDVLLIHHWYDLSGNYYDKYICSRCNALLAGGTCALVVGEHIMPDEMVQRDYIQRRREIRRTYWTELLSDASYEEAHANRGRSQKLLSEWAREEVNTVANKYSMEVDYAEH